MSKSTSRRTILAAAAAFATVPALAAPSVAAAAFATVPALAAPSVAADPIFALIEAHRIAFMRRMKASAEAFDVPDRGPNCGDAERALHAAAGARARQEKPNTLPPPHAPRSCWWEHGPTA